MKVLKTASDGLPVAAEESGDVTDAAVSKRAGFDRGVDAPIAFAERLKNLLHGPFDIERIVDEHGGILPVLPALLCRCRRLPCKSRAQNAKWGS
jgi:hypothetical protein